MSKYEFEYDSWFRDDIPKANMEVFSVG